MIDLAGDDGVLAAAYNTFGMVEVARTFHQHRDHVQNISCADENLNKCDLTSVSAISNIKT